MAIQEHLESKSLRKNLVLDLGLSKTFNQDGHMQSGQQHLQF